MSGDDITGVIFGMGVLVLSTVILVVVLTQAVRYLGVRSQRQADERLADLTQRYEELARGVERRGSASAADLAEIRARVGEIEHLLREVG